MSKSIVIKATISTVGPLSITLPEAEGGFGANRFNNFPIMTRGIDEAGNRQQTGYLPATTIRGFLRRAVTTDAMSKAADAGAHYTLQKAYADLLGQDAESEKAGDALDLLTLKKQREENPIADLFGLGMSLKSRLLVSQFVPPVNVLPDVFTGVRKDLEDTEGVLDALTSADRDAFLGRSEANRKRAGAATVVKGLERKVKMAEKEKGDVKELEKALAEARALEAKYADQMGAMQNSSRTLTSYFALPAGIDLVGRMIIENARPRDISMVALGLNALSLRPLLGGQVARGCGEIAGVFDMYCDGELLKKITIGAFQPANIVEFSDIDFLQNVA
jgi:CRISPR type IV-associated protein Csf2